MSNIETGGRVHHKCDYPNCPLYGTVIQTAQFPSMTYGGKFYKDWVLVRWDGYKNLPSGTEMWTPIEKLEVVQGESR
jgi:hypothetical protein